MGILKIPRKKLVDILIILVVELVKFESLKVKSREEKMNR